MPKLIIKVSTDKIKSEVTRTIEVDVEDVQDEEMLQELVQEAVNEMINVDYEIEDS